MNSYILLGLLFLCISLQVQAKIMRNNALMSKMISHFQQDNNLSVGQQRNDAYRDSEKPLSIQEEQNRNILYEEHIQQREQQMPQPNLHERASNIIHVMQHVLCRNFPNIPCNYIMQDEKINKLIKQSILQLSRKHDNTKGITTQPAVTKSTGLVPVDSEDLSNFLEISHTGFFDETAQVKAQSKPANKKSVWTYEKPTKKTLKKKNKDAKRDSEVYNGKKMRKFYPHKTKYKDKGVTRRGGSYGEYRALRHSEDKVSMSVELPDILPVAPLQKAAPMSFKLEPSDSPVWRIDYMKRGVPSLNNVFSFQGKLMNTGVGGHNQQAADGEGGGERKAFYHTDVLHPDLYIKNNYSRKTKR